MRRIVTAHSEGLTPVEVLSKPMIKLASVSEIQLAHSYLTEIETMSVKRRGFRVNCGSDIKNVSLYDRGLCGEFKLDKCLDFIDDLVELKDFNKWQNFLKFFDRPCNDLQSFLSDF